MNKNITLAFITNDQLFINYDGKKFGETGGQVTTCAKGKLKNWVSLPEGLTNGDDLVLIVSVKYEMVVHHW